ncbi:hypothetical protein AX17_005560 [Amanita inopinata Kibby_2008]|nr:hypothetical protein AX17_005560 [Amanita inopinata Kibby_2008]
MRSYTLANWDGSLTESNLFANSSQSTASKTAQVHGRSMIPTEDTGPDKHHRGGETDVRSIKSRIGGVQMNASSKLKRSIINGYTGKKSQVSSHATDTKLTPANTRYSYVAAPTSQSHLPLNTMISTRKDSRQALKTANTRNGKAGGDMEIDVDWSSADADGESDVEEDNDVIIVNDMLMRERPTSASSVVSLDSPQHPRSRLSPLFTPPSSSSNIKIIFDLTIPSPPPDEKDTTHLKPVGVPSAAPTRNAADHIFTLPIPTADPTSNQKTDSSGPKRRRRQIFSHVSVPPLPSTCSRAEYRPISSANSRQQQATPMLARAAKRLAEIRLRKTFSDFHSTASNSVKTGPVAYRDDDSFVPPKLPSKKTRNASPGPSKLPDTSTNTSPVGVRMRTPVSSPFVPVPGTTTSVSPQVGEKRKYLKQRGEESGNPNVQKKSKVVKWTAKKTEAAGADFPGERQERVAQHVHYNAALDLLRIYLSSIPPTSNPVLAMNTRHIRWAKSTNSNGGCNQFVDATPQKKWQDDSSWFLWPPLRYGFDQEEEDEYYAGGMLLEMGAENEEEITEFSSKRDGQPEASPTQQSHASTERLLKSYTFVGGEPPLLQSPSLRPRPSTVIAENHLYEGGDMLGCLEKLPPPSAKALGKRKAVSPVTYQPEAEPVTPLQHFAQRCQRHYDGLGQANFDADDMLHMEQFFNDLGPSPPNPQSSKSFPSTDIGADNVQHSPAFSIHALHRPSAQGQEHEYDADTLSRALISTDNDPFISGGNELENVGVDPFFSPFNDGTRTIDPWIGSRGYSPKRVFDGVFGETVGVNDTIDPVLLSVPEPMGAGDPVDVPSMFNTQECSTTSLSQPILPSADMTERSPKSISVSVLGSGRLKRAPQHSDMVDIRELDLSWPSSPAEEMMDRDDNEYMPTVTPASLHGPVVDNSGQRRGPRIVSAKELARIQKRKAREREKQAALEKEMSLASREPSITVPVIVPGKQSVKLGPPIGKRGGRRSQYACGPDHTMCHQCRRRTYYLKMKCSCGKFYCNRCFATRYENMPFDQKLPNFMCPACQNTCTCDICTKKRGEVYVSLRPRVSAQEAGKEVTVMKPRKRKSKLRWSQLDASSSGDAPVSEEDEDGEGESDYAKPIRKKPSPVRRVAAVTRPVAPFPPTPIVGVPGSHWGAVYALTGERITTACVGSQNQNVVVSCSLATLMLASGLKRRSKRVFIGHMQPFWGSGMVARYLDDEDERAVRKMKRDGKGQKKQGGRRLYIGDREMLFKRVVVKPKCDGCGDGRQKDFEEGLPFALSPLSSLSSLPDTEDEGVAVGGDVGPDCGMGLGLRTEALAGENDGGGGDGGDPDDVKARGQGRTDGPEMAEGQGGKMKTKGERRRSASFSPDSLEDRDVTRAIVLGLAACGVSVHA